MKKSILILGLMLGTLCLTNCKKDENLSENRENLITLNATAEYDAETKTYIEYDAGSYKPFWSVGDEIGVYTTKDVAGTETVADKNITIKLTTGGAKIATFTGSITAPVSDVSYKFYTYYPRTNLDGNLFNSARVEIPMKQYPTKTSFDPKADVLAGRPITKAVSSGATSVDLSLQFKRKTAVVKIVNNVTNLPASVAATEKIARVKVTFGDINVAGRVKWDLTNDGALDFYSTDAYKSSSVEAFYAASEQETIGNTTVWLSVAPITMAGKDLSFEIETDKGKLLKKTFTNQNGTLTAGNITKFSLILDNTWTVTSEVKKSIAEVRAMGQITISENYYIEGKVISHNGYSISVDGKSLVIQDNTTPNSGINIRLSATSSYTYSLGDMVKVAINGGKLSSYYGLFQVTPVADDRVSKVSSGTPQTPTSITLDDLKSGQYESMYVSIAGVQTKSTTAATFGGAVEMETYTGGFQMSVPSHNSNILKGNNIPTGYGILKGIAFINNTNYQIIPVVAADYEGLTAARVVTFGAPAFSGTMTQNVALSGCKITLPVNVTSATTYKVSVTASGDGSAGITPITNRAVTTDASNNLVIDLSGTPTATGAVTFILTVKTNDATPVDLCTFNINAIVVAAGTKFYVRVTEKSQIVSGGSYLIVEKVKGKVMGNSLNSSSKFLPIDCNTMYDSANDRFISDVSTTDTYALTFTTASNGYTLKFNISGNFICGTGNTTNFAALSTKVPADSKGWWTVAEDGTTNLFNINNVNTTSRSILYRAGSYDVFGTYLTSSMGTEYTYVKLYKLAD